MNTKMSVSATKRWEDPAERERAALRGVLARSRPTFVYGLTKPGDDEVRYIGCSYDPARRLRWHLRHSKTLAVREWVDALSAEPDIVILAEAENRAEGERLERKWIARLDFEGHRLTNTTHNPRNSREKQERRFAALDIAGTIRRIEAALQER